MIHYSLKCDDDHGFESWFASAGAFDALLSSGRVSCPICGSARVEKALMAPSVRPGRDRPEPVHPKTLKAPSSDVEKAITALRRQVEENADYVGLNFAAEARAIHDGEVEARSIYGEARPDEARRLIEDGVPVAPLPFLPQRKAN
jgi:hypothetical protein